MLCKRVSEVDFKLFIGGRVSIVGVAKMVVVKPQKGDAEYMDITLKDKDKEVVVKIFGVSEEFKSTIKEGCVYEMTVDVKDHPKYGLSLLLSGGVEVSEYAAEAFADWVDKLQEYTDKVKMYIEYLGTGNVYGDVTLDIIQKYWEKFIKWPAATGQHHTSFGGLVMHTACVAEGCYMEACRYNKIYGEGTVNVKLIVCSAILHDVMKTLEMNADVVSGKVEYSKRSSLVSHVSDIGTEVVKSAIKLGYGDTNELLEMQHCVLAHSGKLEWGSPIEGHCFEAKILHYIDMMDADGWRYSSAYRELEEGEVATKWSSGGLNVTYRPYIQDNE